MKKLNKTGFVKITLWLFVIVLVCGFSYLLISTESRVRISGSGEGTPYSGKDTIDVDYKNDPKVAEYQTQENEYQKKITSFDPSYYDLPKSNLSNLIENSKCTNGFGGVMPNIHQGIFSEPLYNFDAESLVTSNGKTGYAPYVNSYYVVGDILFKKPLDLFDRKIMTYEQLSRNLTDARTIVGNQAYKNSFSSMESKFGFPQAYLQQQSGLLTNLSVFNDDCVKKIGERVIEFDRIDLAGTPITALFSTKFRTSLFHGVNGLYNYTENTPDFVSSTFSEWIRSNNLVYQQLVNARKNYLFPKGSYLYVPVKYTIKQEIVAVNFNSQVVEVNLNQLLKDVAKNNNLESSAAKFIEEKFNDFTIYKPVTVVGLKPLSNIAFVKKGDKLYLATWELPVTTAINNLEPERSNLVLMNFEALKASLGVIKSFYQGSKFDIGTSNQDLNLKILQSETTAAKNKFDDKVKKLAEINGN